MQQIQFALDSGYPIAQRDKLMRRWRACHDQLQQKGIDKPPDPQPSDQEKEDVLSSAIEIRFDSQTGGGREVRATSDISAGQILLQEEAFSFVLHPQLYSSHCYNCLRRLVDASKWNNENEDWFQNQEHLPLLIPCFRCSQVRFCSTSCRHVAWTGFHERECLSLDLLHQVDRAIFSPLITLRVLLSQGIPALLRAEREGEEEEARKEREQKEREAKELNQIEEKEKMIRSKLAAASTQIPDLASVHSLDTRPSASPACASLRSGYPAFDSLVHHDGALADKQCHEISAFLLAFLLETEAVTSSPRHEVTGVQAVVNDIAPDNQMHNPGLRDDREDGDQVTSAQDKCEVNERQLVCLHQRICRHVRACQVNAIHITDRRIVPQDETGGGSGGEDGGQGKKGWMPMLTEERIACGLFLNLACINHACDANARVTRFDGSHLTLRAVQSIPRGHPVSISYGINSRCHGRSFRQQELKNSYFFDCECAACRSGKEPLVDAFMCKGCNGPVLRLETEDADGETAEWHSQCKCLQCKRDISNTEKREMRTRVEKGKQLLGHAIQCFMMQHSADSIQRADGSQGFDQASLTGPLETRKRLLSSCDQDLLTSHSLLTPLLHPGNMNLVILYDCWSRCCKSMKKLDQAVTHALHSYRQVCTGHAEELAVFNSLYRLLDCYRFLLLRIRSQESRSPQSDHRESRFDVRTTMQQAIMYLRELESQSEILLSRESSEYRFYARQVALIRRLIPDSYFTAETAPQPTTRS